VKVGKRRINTPATHATIKRLELHKGYTVCVRARNSAGVSTPLCKRFKRR
jgi:hypothetical protein